MDRSCKYLRHRFQPAFTNGLNLFLEAARQHLNEENESRCPCRDCKNLEFYPVADIHRHILTKGFQLNYSVWTEHGENMNDDEVDDISEDDGEEEGEDSDTSGNGVSVMDMFDDMNRSGEMDIDDEEIGNEGDNTQDRTRASNLEDMFKEALKELYPGCTKFSALSFILKLIM